ncbi:hypothetical protein [Tautonia sociabilis]|uniref:Uncharacterized protein n=1 Tax=Tautonia sociabilis TaxID=2080755 RepID=A0A432MMK3_9BACT|nr:hypothetical protein [Tautonia sociabilis]RUL88427.1 hypothetical protein TsocGM_06845 [Tautonia sociabilis]
MSKGRPMVLRVAPAWRWQLALGAGLMLSAAGCAQQRQRMVGAPATPGTSVSRAEPGLRVRAPFVDVRVADRQGVTDLPRDGERRAGADASDLESGGETPRGSSRVGLFRSPSLSRSLGGGSPLN